MYLEYIYKLIILFCVDNDMYGSIYFQMFDFGFDFDDFFVFFVVYYYGFFQVEFFIFFVFLVFQV